MLDRDELLPLARRVMAHVRAGTTDQSDRVVRVPTDHYVDPVRWQREIDVIFKRQPLGMALSCELPEPGAYKATDVLGVPVLMTRGTDGVVRAFLNVCRHRGALVVNGCGSARRFSCPYHAWTYDDRGSLVGVYGESTFGDVEREDHGLIPLPCEERAGFVFVVLSPGARLDLDVWLGDYGAELSGLGLAGWHLTGQKRVDGASWKVCYDGYLEGYHFQSLHRTTLFPQTMSNLMVSDAWGPHQRVIFAKHSISAWTDLGEDQWELPTDHFGPVYTIFPHISIAGGWGDRCLVSQLFPGPTPDRSYTIQSFLSRHPVITDNDRATADAYAEFLYQVVRDEDYATGIGIQQGLTATPGRDVVFGRNEVTLQRFHATVDRLLGEAEQP